MPRFIRGPLDGLDLSIERVNLVGMVVPGGTLGQGIIMPNRSQIDAVLRGELPPAKSAGSPSGNLFYKMVRVSGGVEFHYEGEESIAATLIPWSVFEVGYGLRADMPPTVREVFLMHDGHGKDCVVETCADSVVSGNTAAGGFACYGDAKEKDTLAGIYSGLVFFSSRLEDSRSDLLSLVFVNYKPSSHFSSPAKQGSRVTVKDLAAGLSSFMAWTVASLRDLASPCEWVMLSCYRRPSENSGTL